jgi:DNA-binding transcriptional LysR family regulator
MTDTSWDEIRTAYHVARLGTVSGAAEVLGVHHATVIRHIDALEARLGTKLFQRHARGYTPTEAGDDLRRVAQATEDQFTQLTGRVKGMGDSVTGELTVTAVPEIARVVTPALARFQADHPGLVVRFLTGKRLFRLEYGEAHVALRSGSAPDQPDNVVQPFLTQRFALYAARDYADRHGLPQSDAELTNHHFVGADAGGSVRAPFYQWLAATVPAEAVIFRATEIEVAQQAVQAGVGLGFFPVMTGRSLPDLVEAMAPRPEWASPVWLVTHVDLHRTAKVQAALTALKAAARDWTEI